MALVHQTIPGLFGGVSQQASELRHDTQVTEMINCYPTIVGGLQKRPPCEYVYGADDNTGPDYIPNDAFVYMYERDDNETYAIFIKNINGLGYYRIYDLYLKQWTMLDWEANAYLNTDSTLNVKKAFAAATVGDTTYIVNKHKVPLENSTVDDNGDPDWETTFFYWVKRTAGDASDNAALRYTYYIRSDDPRYTGTASSSNNSGNLTDTTASFPATLVGLTLHNTTQGWSSTITSSSSTYITTSSNNTSWNVGDEYEIVIEVTHHDSNDAARSLAAQINGVGDASYSATVSGSVLKVKQNNGYTLSGSDSWGNQASRSWQGKIKKLQDLPNDFGFEGSVVEISGDDDTAFDSYYVKYEDGVFSETFKPNITTAIDPLTMPHAIAIARDTSNNYVDKDLNYTTPTFFRTVEWDARSVGDENSAGMPSFIEYKKPIQDVFFYRNRLGFIAGDNVVLSESAEYYNFFPSTVTSVIDSDVIDVAVDSNSSVYLKYAIPFNKDLLLFGNNAQFVLSSGDTLTPSKVTVQQSTTYNISNIKPVGIGPNIYFGSEQKTYSKIREYYVQPDSLTNVAGDVTGHCPSYIRSNLKTIAASSKNDMVFVLSSETPDTLYVYNFNWNGEEKAQSAWHKWTFANCLIHDIQVVNGVLYLFTVRGANSFIEKINLELPGDFLRVNYEDVPYYYEEDGVTLTREETDSVAQGTGTLIDSSVTLSPIGFATGSLKVDDKRNKFVLKNIQLNTTFGSFYGLEVLKYKIPKKVGYTVGSGIYPSKQLLPSYNLTPTVSQYEMNTDGKYIFSGAADKLDIKITNDLVIGFKINTLDFYGNFIQKSRSV